MTPTFWKFTGVMVFVLAAIGSASLGLAISDRSPPIVYENARALEPSAAQGGSPEVEFKVFRSRVCDVTAKRRVADASGDTHSIPSYTVGLQYLAGRETYQRSITIPTAASVGPAQYQVMLTYVCNVVHRIVFPIIVESPPINFGITPDQGIVPFAAPNEG